MKPERIQQVFLIQMSFVYLWAFSSLYFQLPGLYGDNGILPARSVLKCDTKNATHCAFFGERPTLLHLASHFSLTPLQGLEVLCLSGIVLAALSIVFRTFRDTFVYLALWVAYFSCFQVGQTFLWFQWDTLLIEAGFLTVVAAPCVFLRCKASKWMPQDNVALFLVRWLAFRLMFASGIVKLTSECPTWWGLTALNYHFESQCIPTSLAWFAHQSPEWLKKLSVVSTYVIEIFVPPLFLLPFVHLRKIAFYSQAFFMATIVLTGNYNFFNLLTVALCSTMLIDSSNSSISSFALRKRVTRLYDFVKYMLIGGVYFLLASYSIKLFSLRVVDLSVQSEIAFTKRQFVDALSYWIPKLLLLGCICFVIELVTAIFRCIADFYEHSIFSSFRVLIQCFFVCSICVLLFAISLVPFSYLDRKTHATLWRDVKDLHAESDKFQLTHSYGLFRQMTGVGGRPEVVIEGANDLNGPWKEYEFLYKPGSLDRKLPFVVPHQPRLDWQMWFAALGNYEQNPWFISMCYKLLKNEGQVLKLIEQNPFSPKAPKFIRAQLYHYHFTYNSKIEKNWWRREFDREYMPAISLEDKGVIDFLNENGMIIEKPFRPAKSTVTQMLRSLRKNSEVFSAPQFVWAVTIAVSSVWIIQQKLFSF